MAQASAKSISLRNVRREVRKSRKTLEIIIAYLNALIFIHLFYYFCLKSVSKEFMLFTCLHVVAVVETSNATLKLTKPPGQGGLFRGWLLVV